MSFAWSPELATGNTVIDNQHKELFAAADALFSACQIGRERQESEWPSIYRRPTEGTRRHEGRAAGRQVMNMGAALRLSEGGFLPT